MPSHLEKVIPPPHPLPLQHLCPNRCHTLLSLSLRLLILSPSSVRFLSRLRQTLRSTFPFPVSGISSSSTYPAGTMYSGNLPRKYRFNSSTLSEPSSIASTSLPSSILFIGVRTV